MGALATRLGPSQAGEGFFVFAHNEPRGPAAGQRGFHPAGLGDPVAPALQFGVDVHGRRLEVAGILPTFWDATTNESELNLRTLVETFGELVTPAIPRTTRLREAPARGLTAWEILPPEKLRGYAAIIDRLTH